MLLHTNSPMRKRPKNASEKIHLNRDDSKLDEHMNLVAPIIFSSMMGVIGWRVSGVDFPLLAPFKALLTLKEVHGSSQLLVLCHVLIAHTYEFIVDGALLDNDRWR